MTLPTHSDPLPVFTGLPLFGQIRIEAPSAPGSSSSADAADAITGDQMQARMKQVLTWFAAQSEPKTRHECAAVVYEGCEYAISSTCPRVNALVTLGYLEEVGRSGKRATLSITSAGRAKLARKAA